MKMTAEEAVLCRLGVDFHSPSPGCCGMAGSFGFEPDKYDVSIAIGELELLPAVRQAPPDWLIITDGFSCREQIAQCTARRALHLAEVLQMAIRGRDAPESAPYPESTRVSLNEAKVLHSMRRTGLGLVASAVTGVLLWKMLRSRLF
jgi:hypothetical protein